MQTMTWTEALNAIANDPAGDPAGRERAAEMLRAIEVGELRGVTAA
ncbi:Uncharacterised protein [Mycobacteroides abscessus subsp. abscessus]|nr:hypothetical protein [Mycobacteroides abscessus]SLJ23690.1 Uncharacterised protein [Mycobacteroides abscessus subsp. abscessus]